MLNNNPPLKTRLSLSSRPPAATPPHFHGYRPPSTTLFLSLSPRQCRNDTARSVAPVRTLAAKRAAGTTKISNPPRLARSPSGDTRHGSAEPRSTRPQWTPKAAGRAAARDTAHRRRRTSSTTRSPSSSLPSQVRRRSRGPPLSRGRRGKHARGRARCWVRGAARTRGRVGSAASRDMDDCDGVI